MVSAVALNELNAMRIFDCRRRELAACCLVLGMVALCPRGLAASPQARTIAGQAPGASTEQIHPDITSTHPSAEDFEFTSIYTMYADNPVPSADFRVQTTAQQADPAHSSQDNAVKPVGTAAAPLQKVTGIAASRPVGAVIAPAKQRRARSFLIRTGIVIGGVVAIGTVVLLTRASPSRSR